MNGISQCGGRGRRDYVRRGVWEESRGEGVGRGEKGGGSVQAEMIRCILVFVVWIVWGWGEGE